MRKVWFIAALSVLVAGASAFAAERGMLLRAGDLLSQPFIDAAKSGPIAANQPVTVLARRGPWVQVDVGDGRTGWVRTLNLRLQGAGAPPPQVAANAAGPSQQRGASGQGRGNGRANLNALSNPASALRSGSSGRTVTTGVKGLDEEDINNASPNYAQVQELALLSVDPADAQAMAAEANLKENRLNYLPAGRSR